ncbi:MAG: response regulator [Deltaproteobacteria bacterium]|nr:response regulator [Deltaproteobacteria bacterium]
MTSQIRILMIDDETVFVNSLTKVLTRRGIGVQSAPDGNTGLALLTNEGFDVIVLDMRMPGMDGLATLKAIRERDTLTPVILLTGHIDLKQVSEALKAGAAEVLLKPCPVENLVSSIENAFERKGFAVEVSETL